MKKNIMFITIISALILAACSEAKEVEKKDDFIESAKQKNLITEVVKDDQGQNNNSEINKKFEFDNDVYFVKIVEENYDAFVGEEPDSGIATTKATYDSKKEILEIYRNAGLPTEKTKLIVLYESYSHSDLIYSKLYSIENDTFEFTPEAIQNKYVDNKKRLFGAKDYSIEYNGEDLQFSYGGQRATHILKKNESDTFELKDKDLESTLTISNYGLLNTFDNMQYEHIEGAYIVDDSELTGDSLEQAKKDLDKNMPKIEKALKEEQKAKIEKGDGDLETN